MAYSHGLYTYGHIVMAYSHGLYSLRFIGNDFNLIDLYRARTAGNIAKLVQAREGKADAPQMHYNSAKSSTAVVVLLIQAIPVLFFHPAGLMLYLGCFMYPLNPTLLIRLVCWRRLLGWPFRYGVSVGIC